MVLMPLLFYWGGAIKIFKKENNIIKHKLKDKFTVDDYSCRAIITLACSERHVGSIYQVCNFKYYGLTEVAKDFYAEDGRLNPRGKSSLMRGVYLPRARKHRYAYILDGSLKCNYQEMRKPSNNEILKLECCNGSKKVFDNRYNKWYTCPRCTGKLMPISTNQEIVNNKVNKPKKVKQNSLF